MDKNIQDLAWACLPKEAREETRAEYQNAIDGSDLEDFLIDFFGHHNLTSDTEPEEMLMVERKKVQEYKAYIDSIINGDFSSEFKKGHCYGQQTALDRLFGDKCLPDQLEHRLEQPSVQVEPYTEPETKDPDNRKSLYDALCELESASAKVRKALISLG